MWQEQELGKFHAISISETLLARWPVTVASVNKSNFDVDATSPQPHPTPTIYQNSLSDSMNQTFKHCHSKVPSKYLCQHIL